MVSIGAVSLLTTPTDARAVALFGQSWFACPWRVLALSLITNLACGLGDETLSHAHTLQAAARAGAEARALLQAIVAGLDETT